LDWTEFDSEQVLEAWEREEVECQGK
jgi:hypothetical protein